MTKYKSTIFKLCIFLFILLVSPVVEANDNPWWEFQSVDTMKYSRDMAREKLNDASFDEVIERQVTQIADIGATHIAIATPYDDEFLPFLTRWVNEARKHDLNVWFRGNWSGWEEWFDYEPISREEHLEKTLDFISKNHKIFENGDIFSPCPECENGGPGDPRYRGNVNGYRNFLVTEYSETTNMFRNLGLSVRTNFASMNMDVAKIVMDEDTAKAMGGIIVIDHFVETPEKVDRDINDLAEKTNARIVLGEFGVPIPDVNGKLTEDEQNEWINRLLELVSQNKNLVGLNYWVGYGGSTAIWRDSGEPRKAVETISKYYKPKTKAITIKNELEEPIKDAQVWYGYDKVRTNNQGQADIKLLEGNNTINISASGYNPRAVIISYQSNDISITLDVQKKTLFYRIKAFIKRIKDAITGK